MMLRLLRGDLTESFCHVLVASGFGTFRHLGVRLAELGILTDDRICEIVPVLAHKPVHASYLAEVALLGLRRLLQNLRECDLTFLPRTLRESSVFQNGERLMNCLRLVIAQLVNTMLTADTMTCINQYLRMARRRSGY